MTTRQQTEPVTQQAHHRSHDLPADLTEMLTQEFWDERYASRDQLWSGNPNQRLVEQVSDLEPGTALDVGCGEGADAIWLAEQGWRVTGVDVSKVALARGAQQAASVGQEIADRIAWERADLLTWEPAARQFDLVSAHFIHMPKAERESLFRRLAAAVTAGGSLLIVGHHPSDVHTSIGRPHHLTDWMYTAEEVAELLGDDAWRIVVLAAPAREAKDPDGQTITIHDAVLRAVRHS